VRRFDTSREPERDEEEAGLSDERCKRRFSSQVLRGRHPVGVGDGRSVEG
jgi:hypothetical protein